MGGIYRATISNLKNQDLQQQVFTSDIYQKWRKRKWKLLPATAGIYGWYIPKRKELNLRPGPATAGIYGWYPPKSYLKNF